MKFKLFCDMDGVLVDFLGAANKIVKENGYDLAWREMESSLGGKMLNEKGSDFWSNIEGLDDGKQLWNKVKKYNPSLLSAYPSEKSTKKPNDPTFKEHCIKGKTKWIKENIDPKNLSSIILCKRSEKLLYADKYSILIDDFAKNIKEWEDHGGIGILFRSYSDTIKQLEKYI